MSDTEQGLQLSLNALYQYCQTWKLTANANKTKVVVFSRGKIKKIPTWQLGPSTLETVSEYVYLGITFNYNGSFSKAITRQINLAKRAFYGLMSKIRKLMLPVDIQNHLIDSCILPIMLYGSEVWGPSDLSQVETFHNQMCKQILHLNKLP